MRKNRQAFLKRTCLTSVTGVLVLIVTSALMPIRLAYAESAREIEEVVVSARKRQENLQEVPVVVDVLTEDMIRSQRIENISDIGTIVPGMVAAKIAASTSGVIYLRGVGTGYGNPAYDQAVAINVDGLGINSAQMMNAGMFDLRQIDVLKGPQALFFGKNSPGGVIAIHTNDPGDEFELELTGMYETVAEETTLRGIISGPLSDTLGARIAFGRSEANDSWQKIVNFDRFEQGPTGPVQTAFRTGQPEQETSFVLGTLLWEPIDNFSAKLKYAHLEDNQEGTPYGGLQNVWCPFGAPQARYPVPGDRCKADDENSFAGINPAVNGTIFDGEFAGETRGIFDNENNFAVLEMNLDLESDFTLTSVSGYFDNDELRNGEVTTQVVSGAFVGNRYESEQWSQELRLVSDFDGPFNFMLGAFYEEKEHEYDVDTRLSSFFALGPLAIPTTAAVGIFPLSLARDISGQETTAWSIFSQLEWNIDEKWTLAVGGRYSYEEKENDIRLSIDVPNPYGFPAIPWTDIPLLEPKQDWNNFSPEVTVSYQYTDDIMFFASYREGFKSGGYDNAFGVPLKLAAALTPGVFFDNIYDEENVSGFEVGMKSMLLDGSLRLNITAFSFDYEDLQLSRFDGSNFTFTIFNAGEASVDGLEVESLWLTPVEGLTLTANVAFLESEFDEFAATCWAGQTIALNCDRDPLPPSAGPLAGNFSSSDRAGDSLPLASDLSATLGLNYATQISDNWNLAFNLNASFKDEYNPAAEFTPDEAQQDSFWWTNAGLSLYSSDDKWELFLRGVNLTEEVYKNSVLNATAQGNAATTGTNDASGLPDLMSHVAGGRQVIMGITYRM